MTVTPATIDLRIPPGAEWSKEFALVDRDGSALPLAAYAPYTAQLRRKADGELLAIFGVDNEHVADGRLRISLVGEDTMEHRGRAYWDLIDKFGNPWIEGAVSLKKTITNRAE